MKGNYWKRQIIPFLPKISKFRILISNNFCCAILQTFVYLCVRRFYGQFILVLFFLVEKFSKEIDDIDQGKFTTEKTDGSDDMTDEKYSPPVNHLGQIK